MSDDRDEGVRLPEISVVICTYTVERWDLLVSAVSSVHAQRYPVREVIVVVDHNEPLLKRVQQEIPGVVAIANDGRQGLSGARNSGAAVASGAIVASLDDDAEAAPDWILRLAEDFLDPAVVGVGCSITPSWEGGEPMWFPPEFYWVVGCTYRGVPTTRGAIRNPLGAAMALRLEVFEQVGGYRSELGRFNNHPLGCEETELCVRVQQQDPLALFIQDPRAKASHFVPSERATWRYFRSRCFAEGLSKAAVRRAVGSTDGLAAERAYVTRVLPTGIWNGLLRGLSGDPSAFARALAIIAGLSWTVAGFATGIAYREKVGGWLPRRFASWGFRHLAREQ